MAKGQTVGWLNFGIDGDDKEIKKKFDALEKQAVSIEQIFKNIKINTGGKAVSADVQKAQIAADKLAISQNNVTKSAMNAIKAEEQAEKAIVESNNARERGLAISKQKQNLDLRNAIESAKAANIEANEAIKLSKNKTDQLLKEEKLIGLKKRNSLIGVQGQKDLANAYGLTNKTMFSQKNLVQQLSGAMGIYFSIYQAGAFVKELATVSGEFEKQRVSLAAIIGDADAAHKIFNQIKDLAVISPFNFKELTDYVKQLSAFSIPTNEIYDTTKRLADLSAGLGVDMSRIILAYGQVRSAAVLRGQELRQFTEAGIPLVDELAKKFGELEGQVVSAGEVFDKISNREASFGMVKEIINDLTSEGGKFFEMQEIQSATLAGKISNLRDNYDMMLDSLGKANSGLLHGAMDGLVDVLDNWEKYFAILMSIVSAYGAYKAIVIASSIATNGLSASIKGCTTAQALFNSVSKMNPYGLLAAGIGAAISGLISFASAQSEAREELYKTIGTINNQSEAVNGLIDKLKELTSKANDDVKAQRDRNSIIEQLSKTEPLLASYIKEHATNLKELTKAQKEYNNLMDAQKLAEYIADESNGWFKDGVRDDLKDLQEAQNKLNVAASGLDTTYTKLIEGINKIKKDGGIKTPMGLKEFNKNTLAEIDAIIASEKTRAEKLEEVYTLLDPSRRWRKGIGKNAPTLESNFGEGVFGTPSNGKYAEYTKALGEFGLAAKEANGELDSLSSRLNGFLNNTGNGVENLNKIKDQFETISGITYKSFISKDTDEQTKYLTEDVSKLYNEIQRGESKLRRLVENLGWLGKYGKERILTQWDIEVNGNKDLSVPLDGWRKEIQDLVGTNLTITTESNLNDVIGEMEKQYKELRTRMDEQKPILIKYGFDFGTGQFSYPSSPTITQLGKNFIADKKAADALTAGLNAAGTAAEKIIKPKGGGSAKDVFAEKLKKQIDLLKEARSEYDKLVKAGVSETEASAKIKGLASFNGIDPSKYNEDIDSIISDLQKKGKNIPKEQAEILRSLILNKDTEGLAKFSEQLIKDSKSAIDKIEKELSQYKDQYSLYESIFGITGDKGQAAKLAFGDVSGVVKSYREKLKEELDKTTDPELKKKLQDQLAQFDFDESSKLAKDYANILKEYRSFEQKREDINREFDEELTLLESQPISDRNESAIEELKKKWSEALNSVEDESLKLTPFYQQLFGDIGNYGSKALDIIIKKTKQIVDSAKRNADGGYAIEVDGKSQTLSDSEFTKWVKQLGVLDKEVSSRDPFKKLKDSIGDYKNATNDIDQSNALKSMSSAIEGVGQIAQSVGGDLANMFDALGEEELGDTIGFIGEMAGSIANIGAGIASGNPVQVIQGIIGGITSIANYHDKKLDREIEKSQLEVKKLQNAYKELERIISRQLGAVAEKQAQEMIDNQEKQIDELNKQIEAEGKKKKKDRSAILDMEDQLAEAKDQLKYFYEDLANEQYGIDLTNWASKISDALVDAFASGEDAAKAFDNTVADIMKDVIKNMINLAVIAPAMDSLRKKLFGEGGLLANGTTNLSNSDGAAIVSELMSFKGKVKDAQGIWDYLNNAAKEAGISLENTSDKSTLSKGIQSLTEDTGNIVASYLNTVNANVAYQRQILENILISRQNDSAIFAQQLATLMAIQTNTYNTANNTREIADVVKETNSILKNVTTRGSGTSINT